MDMKEIRHQALTQLLSEEPGPQRGKNSRFAARIGKAPAQISQWLSRYRTIEDETAREIEKKLGKPRWWMDSPTPTEGKSNSPNTTITTIRTPPTLADAFAVLGAALAVDMPDDVRDDVADALAKLARRRGALRDQQLALHMLEEARPSTATAPDKRAA